MFYPPPGVCKAGITYKKTHAHLTEAKKNEHIEPKDLFLRPLVSVHANIILLVSVHFLSASHEVCVSLCVDVSHVFSLPRGGSRAVS